MDAGFSHHNYGIAGHDDADDPDSDVSLLRFFELRRTKHGITTRVKIIQSDMSTPVDTVVQFHTSIAQCYITCDQAVSLRSSLTRNMKSVEIRQSNRRISVAHNMSVEKYKRWGVEFVTEHCVAEMLGKRRRLRRLSSHDVFTHSFAGGVKDLRVAKAVEMRNKVCSKLTWSEGMYEGTEMVLVDVSTLFVSKMRALQEVRQEYREVKEALRGYFQEPLITRGIIKETGSGPFENIFEITVEGDETIRDFSRWLNTFEPISCESYCCLS